MFRLSLKKLLVLTGCIMVFATLSQGQDLGSSNKLFGSSKSNAKSTTAAKPVKKSPPKSTAPAAKSKSAAKTNSTKKGATTTATKGQKKPALPNKAAAANPKSKFTEFKTSQPSKIEITPSKPKAAPPTTTSNVDDRYEELIEAGNGGSRRPELFLGRKFVQECPDAQAKRFSSDIRPRQPIQRSAALGRGGKLVSSCIADGAGDRDCTHCPKLCFDTTDRRAKSFGPL